MEKRPLELFYASLLAIVALSAVLYYSSFFLSQNNLYYFVVTLLSFFVLAAAVFILFKHGYHLSRKEQDEYKQMFYELPFPAIIIDAGTLQIINVNNAAISFYGFSRSYFLSSRIKALFYSKENYFVFRRKMMRGILTGFTWEHRNMKNEKIQMQPLIQEITYKQKSCLLVYFPVHSNIVSNLSVVSSDQDYDQSKYIRIRHFSVS